MKYSISATETEIDDKKLSVELHFIGDSLFISFKQKNEIKKGNTLMEFKYLLFCSSIDLSDVKDI